MPILFDIEDGISLPDLDLQKVEKWIGSVIDYYKKQEGDIGYLFCSDDKILEINNQYLQHDYYTDIITFDYCEDNTISGDMFISLETVVHNAKQYGVTYQSELLRVIIHGILHLCGLKDKTKEEEKNMREEEDRALSLINIE